MEHDLVHSLTNLFLASTSKSTAQYMSLRFWHENGEIKYFFTNAPPRKKDKKYARPNFLINPEEMLLYSPSGSLIESKPGH